MFVFFSRESNYIGKTYLELLGCISYDSQLNLS